MNKKILFLGGLLFGAFFQCVKSEIDGKADSSVSVVHDDNQEESVGPIVPVKKFEFSGKKPLTTFQKVRKGLLIGGGCVLGVGVIFWGYRKIKRLLSFDERWKDFLEKLDSDFMFSLKVGRVSLESGFCELDILSEREKTEFRRDFNQSSQHRISFRELYSRIASDNISNSFVRQVILSNRIHPDQGGGLDRFTDFNIGLLNCFYDEELARQVAFVHFIKKKITELRTSINNRVDVEEKRQQLIKIATSLLDLMEKVDNMPDVVNSVIVPPIASDVTPEATFTRCSENEVD